MSSPAKVVLITGSSSGIGAATARLFAKRGFRVAVTGSNKQRVDQVAAECLELSPDKLQPLALVADLSHSDNGKLLVQSTLEHFGRLDVLVNNVGVYELADVRDERSFDTYRRTMSINVDSIIRSCMQALEHLQRTSGCIVFVSSVASLKPVANNYAYPVSKAALSMFAKCLACDAAPLVRVNTVSPGPVDTPIFDKVPTGRDKILARAQAATLLGRAGHSDEVASAIFYLASQEAAFITGAELFVDGGLLCKHGASSASSQADQS